jgi:hypothetical protein
VTSLHRATAVSLALLYLTLAFHFEDALFPALRFDMFSHPWLPTYGTQLARLPSGEVVHPTTLDRWDCPDSPPPAPTNPDDPCTIYQVNSGTERHVLDWLRTHPAGDGPPLGPVELIRRVYRFPAHHAPPVAVDCPVMTCRAGHSTP